jgi:hypothetical protein
MEFGGTKLFLRAPKKKLKFNWFPEGLQYKFLFFFKIRFILQYNLGVNFSAGMQCQKILEYAFPEINH